MRIVLALLVLIAVAGVAPKAEAGCIRCPSGYNYWHSKEACVPKIVGFVGTPAASTWVEALPKTYYSGGDDEPNKENGPATDR